MRFSTPPILATWLLSHFLPGSENDHIAGDLMEGFQSGRSRTWYWKEVLAAIVIGVSNETVKHPLSVLTAVSSGWGTWLLFYYVVATKVLFPVFRSLFFSLSGYPFAPNMLVWMMLSLLVLAASGWVAARFHRPRGITAVLLFALSFSINQLRFQPSLWSTATNSLTNTRFVPYLVYALEVHILWPAAILFGGLYSGSPQTSTIRKEESL